MTERRDGEWRQLLRAYSDALDEQRASLLAIEADTNAVLPIALPQPFEAPADMPPLPASLQPWARNLVEQTGGLIQLASELAQRTAPRRQASPRRTDTVRPVVIDRAL